MNKFRFFLSALLCLLSFSSSWAYTTVIDGVTWTWDTYNYNNTTEAYISGVSNYSEHKDNLIVPSSVSNGTTTYTVTSVGHPTSSYTGSFYKKTDITSVTIPTTVRTIGYQTFYGCSGLTSVVIPNSVTKIGSDAFYNCSKINEIYITDVAAWCNISGLNYLMGYGASSKTLYIDNEAATDVVIPEGPTTIPAQAFRYFKNITSVTIPNSVTSIGNYAFHLCIYEA